MDRREIGCPKHLAAELNETPVFADGSLHGTNCGKNRPLHSERQLGYGGLVQCFPVEETRCPPPRPACRWQSPERAARHRTGSAWTARSPAASPHGHRATATTATPAHGQHDSRTLDNDQPTKSHNQKMTQPQPRT